MENRELLLLQTKQKENEYDGGKTCKSRNNNKRVKLREEKKV